MTLTGHISSSGSLLVLCMDVSSTPHTWTPRDLGFSLTDNWCMVRDPPLVAKLCCLSHRCPMSHRLHSVVEDPSAHPGDRRLTTLRRLDLHVLRDIGPHRSWDPAYMAPPSLAVNDVRGLVDTVFLGIMAQVALTSCWL